MADQKTFPAEFPEIASPSDDTWIVVYGKEAGSAAPAAGGKIKVGSLPSGDGGVPDDGTVPDAKPNADTGEQAALRVKIGTAPSTALTRLAGTDPAPLGNVTTQGPTEAQTRRRRGKKGG